MSGQITFKSLSPQKKLEHIWAYYRFHILAVIAGGILLASLISTLIGGDRSVLDVIMVDSNANAHSDARGFDEFLEGCGIEPYEGAVTLNANLSFYSEEEMARLKETERNQAALDNYDKQQMLFTLMAGGNMDVFLGKGETFLSYVEQGVFLDLSAVLPPELLAMYEGQLVYAEEEGVRYPCAVALEDNPWLAENGYYTECYLGLLALGDEPEMAARFAEFLLRQ